MCSQVLQVCVFIFLIFNLFSDFSQAQRILLPPSATPLSCPSASENLPAESAPTPPHSQPSLVLKTYPDGTKKIVPLESLNFRDDGAAFGGAPKLSLYDNLAFYPNPPSPKSPERLSVAAIGTSTESTTFSANLPASPDPLAGATQVASLDPMGGSPNTDPMGGGAGPDPMSGGLSGNQIGRGPVADPLGGGGTKAPIDPLAGSTSKTAPPLQTVSGKPAPVVGGDTMLQLGEWESFFFNAGIGGSYQGQLTARRVWNGNNRQAYPYNYPVGTATSENFTFNPGFRLDVEFGYNFYEWLGVGLQTGLIYNGLNQYNVAGSLTYNGTTYTGSLHNSADGELVQVPIQINGILRWPGDVKFRPFIGGGVGAIWQQLDVNNFYAGPLDVQGNFCRSAFQFGWNAQAGLTYTVEPGLDFYGAFKMLSAFMPVIGNYQFENSYNFAVEVGIQSRF